MKICKKYAFIICLFMVVIMFLSIGLTVLSVNNAFASENSILTFAGVSGSPSGSVLHNSTNTYSYNGENNITIKNEKSLY